MTILKRDDGDYFYTIHGNGPPLVIMRGLARSIRHWDGYEHVLAKHFRVICVDHRGMGRTTIPMKIGDTLFDLAQDVAELLDHLKIDKAHILGVSLGGMVALAMGIKFPKKVRSITAVNSSIGGTGKLRLSLPAIASIAMKPLPSKIFNRNMVRVLTGPMITGERINEIAERYQKIDAEEGIKISTFVGQLFAGIRFWVKGELEKMTVPTMILLGTGDQFVPQENSELLAEIIPNCELVKIEHAGHELFIDAPEEGMAAVKKFTDKH